MPIEQYNLELSRLVKEIKKHKARSVLLQLPDGLKPKATEIADYLKRKTNANIIIWFDTCFGACDLPSLGIAERDIDLLIHFGHKQASSLLCNSR